MFVERRLTLIIALAVALLFSGCTVDKTNPKYDQLRYDELQDTNCHDMASLLASTLVSEEPEKKEIALKRCQDMKSLSFEQYKRLADYARQNGKWDIYTVFPSMPAPSE